MCPFHGVQNTWAKSLARRIGGVGRAGLSPIGVARRSFPTELVAGLWPACLGLTPFASMGRREARTALWRARADPTHSPPRPLRLRASKIVPWTSHPSAPPTLCRARGA